MSPSLPLQQQSVFSIEIDKIKPNPYQPRREFESAALHSLAESIQQYGILQPLVVVRKEEEIETGTTVQYELIAGERRLRAAQIAGLKQVPVVIRKEPGAKVKLELALIENIQRKDLNSIERAKAFKQLMENFSLRHLDIGNIVGKSREYVSNTIRLLLMPQSMQQALIEGKISEGHTRPLLMLTDKPEEQEKLFFDIVHRNVSVRDAEKRSRRVAIERARKRDTIPDPDTRTLESRLSEVLGTRVAIERKGLGGKLSIDFFSEEDLRKLFSYIHYRPGEPHPVLARVVPAEDVGAGTAPDTPSHAFSSMPQVTPEPALPDPDADTADAGFVPEEITETTEPGDAVQAEEKIPASEYALPAPTEEKPLPEETPATDTGIVRNSDRPADNADNYAGIDAGIPVDAEDDGIEHFTV